MRLSSVIAGLSAAAVAFQGVAYAVQGPAKSLLRPPGAQGDPDDDALRFYRAIARAGRRMLRPGGKLYFEIYERSAGQMRLLLGEEGYTDTEVREDLNGKPRMVCSRMK